MNSTRWLYLAVFTSGMAVMGVEMSAVRLFAPFFGGSFEVWTLLLALVLVALAGGYMLGGSLADRRPEIQWLPRLLLIAGAVVVALPWLGRKLLAWLALDQQLGVLTGTSVATLLLVVPPLTLLAMVSPYAVRVASTDPAAAGRVTGTLQALSTLGSLLGTCLPGLVLLQAIGTAATFWFFGMALIAVGGIGSFRNNKKGISHE